MVEPVRPDDRVQVGGRARIDERTDDHVDRVLDQWRRQRPDLDPDPMGVIGRLTRAARILERELRETFARYGLQPGEFDILATLRRAGPPYRLTAGALAASSMRTSGAMTNRIDRLTAKGLVTRETDPDNRRTVQVALTDSGLELIDTAVVEHLTREEHLLAPLAATERRQLADLLRTLLLGLEGAPD